MLFELHVTTDPDVDHAKWRRFWLGAGMKPLHIELVGGEPEFPTQIMSASVADLDVSTPVGYKTVYDWLDKQVLIVKSAGFRLRRVKLEMPLDKSAPFEGEIDYYECHIKSALPSHAVDRAVDTLTMLGWKASRNVWFAQEDGLEKWYFTKRYYPLSYSGSDLPNFVLAGNSFTRSFDRVTKRTWNIVRMESEAVIFDSTPGLDKGWANA